MKINCDLGEGLDEVDAALMPLIDQVNIACGAHAGTALTMARCLSLAKRFHVEVGAHPSYPDKKNFGRVSLDISLPDLYKSIMDQLQTLHRHCLRQSFFFTYVKPHGALYNDAAKSSALFDILLRSLVAFSTKNHLTQLALMVPGGILPESHLLMAQQSNVPLITEGFVDRAYCNDGHLLARSVAGAVHTSKAEVIKQVSEFMQGGVYSANGQWLSMVVSSLCVHGDTPGADVLVRAVKQHMALQQ